MRKNIFVIILITILMSAILLISCGANDEADESATENRTAAVQAAETEPSSEAAGESTSSGKKSTANASDKSTASNKKATESTKQATKSTQQATESTKQATKSTQQATKSTQQATKATEAAKVCTITIEGFCDSKSVEIKSGDSVYDILKKSGANVSARSTGYGLYVEGINGRFEFDEGPTSGWVYTVNGSRPNMSCNKYEVKSGDKIVWTYVEEV